MHPKLCVVMWFAKWLLLLRIIRCLPTSKGLRITSTLGAGVG